MKKKHIVTVIFALFFLVASVLAVFISWRVKPLIGSSALAPSLPEFEGEMIIIGALLAAVALFGVIILCLGAYITSAAVCLVLSIISLHSSLRCVRITALVSVIALATTLVLEVIVLFAPI